MRPHIICHMLSSVDGKIDGASLRAVTAPGDYEATGTTLDGDAWVCGRTTMQQHFAEDEPFVSASNRPAGPQPVHVARKAKSYAVSVDTTGKPISCWSSSSRKSPANPKRLRSKKLGRLCVTCAAWSSRDFRKKFSREEQTPSRNMQQRAVVPRHSSAPKPRGGWPGSFGGRSCSTDASRRPPMDKHCVS